MDIITKNSCSQECLNKGRGCDNKFCENWIEYSEDNNCIDVALAKNDYKPLGYRDIAERIGITAMGIYYTEERALKKIIKEHGEELKEYYS